MARFLICTMPAVGHVNPGLPIARKLVERGHEVWWYTGKAFQAKIEATGARYVPMNAALDISEPNSVSESLVEKRNALQGPEQLKFDLKYFFGESAVSLVKDCTDILREFPADVLLCDFGSIGVSWMHEKGGPPWAMFGITILPFSSIDIAPLGLEIPPNTSFLGRLRNILLNWMFQRIQLNDVTLYLNELRGRLGLSPDFKSFFDATLSPYLYIQGTIPEFEYPRSDLPPQVHFVGPFLSDSAADFTPPAWWNDLKDGKPVIHVTQGTVATEADDLIVPTLQALADEDVLVVVTTGGQPVDSINLDRIPVNARIEPFISHYHLLPHVDVMVTNGGYNGVHIALANGVPLVAAGQSEDKPEVCARIEWSGVGINLKTKNPTPMQIKEAVKKILTSPDYRQRAQHFKAEIARTQSPTQAAILLEQLAATKQPVFRD